MRLFSFRFATAALCGVTAMARAQGAPQLPSQLGPEARATILRLLDSARTVGLPTTPLTDKAAEGVLKGADDRRIVAALQTLTRQLGEASDLLGKGPLPYALLGATASALQAGVLPADLRRLVSATPGGTGDSRALVGALVTLVDLIAKRIPATTATASIEDLLKRRATEDQFVSLRAEVAQDILSGQSPEAALAIRARLYAKALDGAPGAQSPRRSPPARPPM
jgi:hypothetical protein